MLLTEAIKDNTTLKVSIRGDSGSGKSFSAACLAIGLHKHIGSKKPIALWDTEDKAAYMKGHFDHNGIKLMRVVSRLFTDADTFFREAEQIADIAIIDTLTHIWEDIIETYKKQAGIEFMRVWDWGKVKPPWREKISYRLTQSPLHLIICGRITDIIEPVEIDREKIIVTTGSKMSAEKSTEYEAALTIEMKKFTLSEQELKDRARSIKYGKPIGELNKVSRHKLTIIKDSANLLSGKAFVFEPTPGEHIKPDNPVFDAIKPFVDFLEIGATHKGIDRKRQAEPIFAPRDRGYEEKKRKRTILIEKIKIELDTLCGRDKKKLRETMDKYWQTTSWTEIAESLSMEIIRDGYDKLLLDYRPTEKKEEKSDLPEGWEGSPDAQREESGSGASISTATSEKDATPVTSNPEPDIKELEQLAEWVFSARDEKDALKHVKKMSKIIGYDASKTDPAKLAGNLAAKEYIIVAQKLLDYARGEKG